MHLTPRYIFIACLAALMLTGPLCIKAQVGRSPVSSTRTVPLPPPPPPTPQTQEELSYQLNKLAEAPMPEAAPVSQPVAEAPEKRLWNLQDADIRAVVDAVSRTTGKNFIIDPRVQGKVTIVSSKPLANDEVYQVFLSALQVLGYAAIPSGSVIKIVPATSARSLSGPVATAGNPGQGDESVVRVMNVQNVSANQLVPILRPLMPETGVVSAYSPTNSLVLAGEANNVNRLVHIVENMDRKGAREIRAVPLRHASAEKLITALNSLIAADNAAGKITNVAIAADKQSNSIIVSGNPDDQMRMFALIAEMDENTSGLAGNTQVFYLNYLKAKNFAPILTKIANSQYLAPQIANKPGVAGAAGAAAAAAGEGNQTFSIQAEPNTNAIVVSAPPEIMDSLRTVIHKLDVPPKQVLVEAIIAQVDEDQVRQLGISWGYNNGPSDPQNPNIDNSAGVTSGFNLGVGVITSGNIQTIINALSTSNSADILSTPSLVVLDNQKASIAVGKTVSVTNRVYATSNTGTTATQDLVPFTTLEQQNVALKLTVLPQISPSNTVRLILDQQNDTLQNPDNPTTTPIINTSDIKTSVMVKSGDVLVLGGLISHELTEATTKIPVLSAIPGIGKLFQYKDKRLSKRNLLIFLRPIILGGNSETATSSQITADRYDYMRQQQIIKRDDQNIIQTMDDSPVLPPKVHMPHGKLPKPFGRREEECPNGECLPKPNFTPDSDKT